MDRRQFCQGSLAAAASAAIPSWALAATAEASIPAIKLDGTETEISKAALKELGQAMQGQVVLSGHPAYDTMRMVWNGMHDRRPALIARCAHSGDVQQAVNFARDNGLLTAVRGGGHSWPGKSVCDGGIMIDLADMVEVQVDTGAKTATAPGGALLGHLDNATLPHGLVTTAGVVSHTGVGGFTLGGGFGRLNRLYGLAIDNLLSAEIVTADGQLRTVSAEQEPELFWAIRGGGGNFGVATSFTFQLHPFKRELLSGMMVFAKKVATAIKAAIPCNRIGVSVVGLEVPHAHVHLIPINAIEDMTFTKAKLRISHEELAQTAAAIARHFS